MLTIYNPLDSYDMLSALLANDSTQEPGLKTSSPGGHNPDFFLGWYHAIVAVG